MKPKPFASLNHFTFPVATELLLMLGARAPLKRRRRRQRRPLWPALRKIAASTKKPPEVSGGVERVSALRQPKRRQYRHDRPRAQVLFCRDRGERPRNVRSRATTSSSSRDRSAASASTDRTPGRRRRRLHALAGRRAGEEGRERAFGEAQVGLRERIGRVPRAQHREEAVESGERDRARFGRRALG